MNALENFASRVFNLLSLVKYVIEKKACTPFQKDETNDSFKKPSNFEPYYDTQDRFFFDRIMNEHERSLVKESIKTYHYFRRKSEKITESLVVLYGEKGGQITIPFKICTYLMDVLECYDVIIEFEFVRKFPKKMDGEEVTEWGNVYRVKFKYQDSEFQLETFLYNVAPRPDSEVKDPFIVSFIEGSIVDVNDGDMCLKVATEVINEKIRNVALEDCF